MDDLGRSIGQFVAALLNPRSTRGVDFWFSSDEAPAIDDMAASPTLIPSPSLPMRSMADRAQEQIAGLQKIDPDFSDVQFLGQAATIYGAALAAECSMNVDALASIATPALIASFKTRLTTLSGAGLACVVKDIKLLGTTIFKISMDGTRQSIVVRFVGTGVRATQDSASGAAVDGSLTSNSFTEFATFVRPAGTTTPKAAAAGGAINCPSCGAPTVAGAATCPFCGTQLTGTGSVWLLDHLSFSAYT